MAPSAAITLHLLLPGLAAELQRPRLPALQRLISRADVVSTSATNPLATLFQLFGYIPPLDQDLPSAPLCRLADTGQMDNKFWFHADPVQLRVDMERVWLGDAQYLDMQPAESRALAQRITTHFADLNWRLETPTPDHWYLQVSDAPNMMTTPLFQVAGRSVLQHLPHGPDGAYWRRLLNEIQMLLFAAPENQARRTAGQLEIGGLWLWGGGYLPNAATCHWTHIYGDSPLLRGLARHAGIAIQPWPVDCTSLGFDGHSLGLREDLWQSASVNDVSAWKCALLNLEPLFVHLLRELQRGHLHTLWLDGGSGHCWRITRLNLARFWRRARWN